MKSFGLKTAMAVAALVATAAESRAQCIQVSNDIAVSTTWTADNCYDLQEQIYVLPGASLTIEAGTVVANSQNGSLTIAKGAQIFINGTQDAPVIFTSDNDVATWDPQGSHPTGRNPKTGTWRASANEWGSIAILGRAYISENKEAGNVPSPNAGNQAIMEGLIEAMPGDPLVRYGGGNDNDDSGSISYLSSRYAGLVIGLNNELNGISLGGVGRETDIHHVEIMNNVDDGIEIFGGTVNLKYFSIWNVGDDSLDIDQGWRGKAQFGLIVQGYSLNGGQGSGVGDNCMEMDGAEDSNYQPVTTSTIYNMTVIGQPLAGDGGTAWRDNARVQVRNSIFMDLGERLVRFDDSDGDCANGYGHNNTLGWAATWNTAFDAAPAHPNDPGNPAAFYPVQCDGNLAEITDSVFFRNLASDAYTEAQARGVLDPSSKNELIPGFDPADAPIADIQRGPQVNPGGLPILPVITLNPRPINEAVTSCATAPGDGFFSQVQYRGAFRPGPAQAPNPDTWLANWTASDAYDFTPGNADPNDTGIQYCTAKSGLFCGTPNIFAHGRARATAAGGFSIVSEPARANRSGVGLYTNNGRFAIPFQGGTLCVAPAVRRTSTVFSGGQGEKTQCAGSFNIDWNAFVSGNTGGNPQPFTMVPGTQINFQFWGRDTPGTGSFLSAGIEFIVQP